MFSQASKAVRLSGPAPLTPSCAGAVGGHAKGPRSPSCCRPLSCVKWPASFIRGLEPPHSASTRSLIAILGVAGRALRREEAKAGSFKGRVLPLFQPAQNPSYFFNPLGKAIWPDNFLLQPTAGQISKRRYGNLQTDGAGENWRSTAPQFHQGINPG